MGTQAMHAWCHTQQRRTRHTVGGYAMLACPFVAHQHTPTQHLAQPHKDPGRAVPQQACLSFRAVRGGHSAPPLQLKPSAFAIASLATVAQPLRHLACSSTSCRRWVAVTGVPHGATCQQTHAHHTHASAATRACHSLTGTVMCTCEQAPTALHMLADTRPPGDEPGSDGRRCRHSMPSHDCQKTQGPAYCE
jgi:hypothetical protein